MLANSRGLVLATDSRISHGGIPMGERQKLFVLDDHTVLSIANWYSSPGPSMDDQHFPGYQQIPDILKYVSRLDRPDRNLESKIKLVTDAICLALDTSVAIESTHEELPGSTLLFGTYEGDHYRIAKVTMERAIQDGHVSYSAGATELAEVGQSLVYLTAGIRDVVDPILSGTGTTKSLVLQYYQSEMVRNHGSALKADDMEQEGRALEIATASDPRYRKIVGGQLQMVTLVRDKISGEDSILQSAAAPNRVVHLGGGFNLDAGGTTEAMRVDPPLIGLIADMTISNAMQHLDRILFYRVRFRNCTMIYTGSFDFFLDTSNVFIDSHLVVAPGVDAASPILARIRKDFPNLPISFGPDPNPKIPPH